MELHSIGGPLAGAPRATLAWPSHFRFRSAKTRPRSLIGAHDKRGRAAERAGGRPTRQAQMSAQVESEEAQKCNMLARDTFARASCARARVRARRAAGSWARANTSATLFCASINHAQCAQLIFVGALFCALAKAVGGALE